WEERNKWFSDLWADFKGIIQSIPDKLKNEGEKIRERTAAFPIELPYRLINMYSVYCDMVLDPFWGTGTTTIAAMICGRNSIGYEINPEFRILFESRVKKVVNLSKNFNSERLRAHIDFTNQQLNLGKEIKHKNTNYGFKVITSQEKELLLYSVNNLIIKNNAIIVNHEPFHLPYE
ncbi:MAG: DNA methyltransferase, partial [Candidatus Lokiarchaeota archaeon]